MAESFVQEQWANCPIRDHTQDGITPDRIAAHDAKYTKPRPARWWEWHCDACNAPQADDPEP